MYVDIIGPNLPERLACQGEIHVHAHGCGDVARQYGGHHVYTEYHETVRGLVEEFCADLLDEDPNDTWEAYSGEFYLAPCVRTLLP